MPNRFQYSMNRRDKKLAGVASTLGDIFNLDPTFIRIGFVALAVLISWKLAVIAYIAGGIYLHAAKRQAAKRHLGWSDADYDRHHRPRRTSVKEMRDNFDHNDRRMMAIDHHLHSAKNDELAREIEALRGGK